MAAPLIFISHSAKEPGASALMPELAHGLREAGLNPWYDEERLRLPGFHWRKEIDEALHLCRAAIVLVSPSALRSGWVAYEASVLAHRSRVAPGFLLLPILLDDVGVEDLRAEQRRGREAVWQPIALDAVQAAGGDDPALSQGEVLERLRPLRERYRPDSPEARLEIKLVHLLKRAGEGTLQAVAYRLQIQPRQWEIDLPTALARRLLEVPIQLQYHALRLIGDVDRDAAVEAYRLVAPHGWITAEAAEQIRSTAARPCGERALGLNAELPGTYDMHVRCGFFDWKACEVEGNVSDNEEDVLVKRARASLLQWMRWDSREPEPDNDEIDDEIAASHDEMPFLVLPPDAAVPAVLSRIRGAWPHVPVLLRCPGESLERLAVRGLPHVVMLDPPISRAEEARIMPLHDKNLYRLEHPKRQPHGA